MSSSAPSARAAVKTQVLDGSAKIRFPTPGRTTTAVDANQLGSKNAAKGADDAAFAPLITNLADARDEVDRRNTMFQPAIGAQEELAEALALKIGDRIVDAVTKALSAIVEALKLAPAPATDDDTKSAGLAESIIRKLSLAEESSEDGTGATGAGYSCNSSEETAATAKGRNKAARREKSKAAKARGRPSSRRPSEEQAAESNPCKHCRTHGRHLRHPKVSSSKCFWNKKYKGFRPLYVCRTLKLRFKQRADFPAALGGYPSDSDAETTSDEE